MVYENEWFKKYGASLFVVAGLAVIGITVSQVQQESNLPTRAAGEIQNQATEMGIWFEENKINVDNNNQAFARIKLESLDKTIQHVRLVLQYDPSLIKILDVRPGSAFEDVKVQKGEDSLSLISEGDFFGQSTWVILQVELLQSGKTAELISTNDLSSMRYEDGSSRSIQGLQVTLTR